MIPSRTVQEKTGLSRNRLVYLRRLHLIPAATHIYNRGQTGSTSAYPATIFTRIRVIEFLQGHGFTLIQIAQSARDTPFECPPTEAGQ